MANCADSLKNFLIEIINEINKQSHEVFELNQTPVDYFSIQRAGKKIYKNVVCFVKGECVLSISEYANINESLFENPPYNKLKKRPKGAPPPKGLQLRPKDWDRYSHHVEYNLKKDENIILSLCRKACENYRPPRLKKSV